MNKQNSINTRNTRRRFNFRLFPVLALVAALALMTRAGDLLMGHWDSDRMRVAQAVEEVDEKPPPLPGEMEEENSHDEQDGDARLMRDALAGSDEMAFEEIHSEPQEITFSKEELELLQALSKRREALDKREAELAQREILIKAAEKNVQQKIEELKQLKREIEALLDDQQKVQEERLKSLVKVYENMKPQDAARILNSMDLEVVLAVVGRMSERKMAPVLAQMDPERARLITIRLAEQKRLPKSLEGGTNPLLP